MGYVLSLLGALSSIYLSAGNCPGDSCLQLNFLGIPVAGYGALFYIFSACLFALSKGKFLRFLLYAGVLAHGFLIYYMVEHGYVCIVCLAMAGLTLCLAYIACGPVRPLNHFALLLPAFLLAFTLWSTFQPPAKALDVPERPELAPVDNVAPSDAGKQTPVRGMITVLREDGVPVSLNIKERPALLFSDRCKHCREALEDVALMPPDERPYLISIVFNDWRKSVSKTAEKLNSAGLTGERAYFSSGLVPDYVPCLLVWDGQKLTYTNYEKRGEK